MRRALRLMLLLTITVGVATPAVAQGPWSVFVGAGAAGFGGGADALDPPPGEPTQYKPTPTTRLHAGLAREIGRGAITFDASYARSGLGGYGGTINVAFSPTLTLYDLRLLGSYSIARLGDGSLRVGVGPMLQLWSGAAVSRTQTRLGGAASVTVQVPMSRSIGLLVSGSLGVSSSPFDQRTLDNLGLEALTTWTRELGVGVRLSL